MNDTECRLDIVEKKERNNDLGNGAIQSVQNEEKRKKLKKTKTNKRKTWIEPLDLENKLKQCKMINKVLA